MPGRLEGKVAIITGAAGGIGRASALRFAAEGAKLVLVDRDEEALAGVADELGGEIAIQAGDVSQQSTARTFIDRCMDRFGRLDILFANAGTEGTVAPLTQLSEQTFDEVLGVNVKGPWLGMKHAVPRMVETGSGGSIVVTSSVAGLIGSPGLGAYIASKHALLGLVKTGALELGPQGIRVNAVCPGPVDNRMMQSIESQASPDSPQTVRSGFEQRVALGRYATNEEIANLALFLASDESSYCTGSAFTADGGLLAQ